MDDTIATELHYAMFRKKETERKSQVTKLETKFQTALEEFQNEKLESEKPLDSSEITVAEPLATEPSILISESNRTHLDSLKNEKETSETNDSIIQNNITSYETNDKPSGQTADRKEAKNLQTPNLAKIFDIKKMIYQLAGDQKVTDEYLIEIIYSKVKSASTEPLTYPFFFIIYLFI